MDTVPANALQVVFFGLPESLQLFGAVALFLGIGCSGLKVLYELGKWLSDL